MPRFKRTAENQPGAAQKSRKKKKDSQLSRSGGQAAPSWSLLPTSAAQRGDIATLDALNEAARRSASGATPEPLETLKQKLAHLPPPPRARAAYSLVLAAAGLLRRASLLALAI